MGRIQSNFDAEIGGALVYCSLNLKNYKMDTVFFCIVKNKLELFGEFLETENVACLKFTCLILDCYRHLALTAYCKNVKMPETL